MSADIAHAFGWSLSDLRAETWDDLMKWHAEVRRIYKDLGRV
ncbi:GpE family phage tail protein [Paracoccus sp. (in: a-proteobacteria)]